MKDINKKKWYLNKKSVCDVIHACCCLIVFRQNWKKKLIAPELIWIILKTFGQLGSDQIL